MSAILPRKDTDELIFHGERVDLVLRSMPLPAGRVRQREVVLHPGAVIILPVLPDGRIVLIRNRRHTVDEVLLELPAGTLERDETGKTEDPVGCAARELIEETGYRAGRLEGLGWFYTSPGILTEKMWAFVATELAPGRQELEETEQIEVEVLEKDAVLRFIRENRIVDAKTIATVLKYFIGPETHPMDIQATGPRHAG
jgi:ADP-ribose pyrophosphatase